MQNNDEHLRTPQELVDENIQFFRTLGPDDIEYTNEALKVISANTAETCAAILDGIRNVDMRRLFNVPEPCDHHYVRHKDRLFFWHTLYFNIAGKRLTTWDEVLNVSEIIRVMEIAVEEDHQKPVKDWNDQQKKKMGIPT